jgi:hypothetical protein
MRSVKDPSRLESSPFRLLFAASVSLSALGAVACGRKATPEDCNLIVDRYVEIELSALNVTDPKVIEQRKADMHRDLSDDLKACPGKRVTDSMIACVRQASSNAELDKCTRW